MPDDPAGWRFWQPSRHRRTRRSRCTGRRTDRAPRDRRLPGRRAQVVASRRVATPSRSRKRSRGREPRRRVSRMAGSVVEGLSCSCPAYRRVPVRSTARLVSPPSPCDSGRRPMTLLGHPAGLFLLFLVEMWERFSYYGMRGLLVLYLVQSAHPHPDATGFINPGRGWSRGDASVLYGWYTGMAYLLPIAGGWLADRALGTHRSMLVGGLVIALGHTVLAVSGMGSLWASDAGMSVFVFGLALIAIGTGHFKPCVSVMVGQLYAEGDARRDGAFTIFYMGINLGAFLAAFVCGTLGERVGWHWGFGAAAVGMLAGLALYVALRQRLLGDIGRPAAGRSNLAVRFALGGVAVAALFALFHHAGVLAAFATAVPGRGVALVLVVLVIGWAVRFVARLEPNERGPTATIFVFMLFNAVFLHT